MTLEFYLLVIFFSIGEGQLKYRWWDREGIDGLDEKVVSPRYVNLFIDYYLLTVII